jgi:hypothetical protein
VQQRYLRGTTEVQQRYSTSWQAAGYPPAKGGELEGGLDGEEEGEEDVHVDQDIRQNQVGVVVLGGT